MSSAVRTTSPLLIGWLLLTSVGCATLNLSNIDLRSRKATARNPAVRIVCLWEPAEGRDPKGVPCQGFAGQILFLTNTSLPVSVDGDVRIYLFDDQGTPAEQAEPIHKFDFDSGAWARHYTYGTLGPAYNVFIPYMRRGVYEANCALRVRLTPKSGPAVFSDMTSIELLGFGGGKPATKGPVADPRVEETAPEDPTAANRRRRTTTIVLNSDSPANGKAPEAVPNRPSDGTVQQAHFETETDVKPLTAADVRIAQLEQMVSELRAMHADQAAPAVDPAADPSTPPRRLEEPDDDRSRFKVRAAQGAPVEPKPEAEKQQVRNASATAAGSLPPKSHPLSDLDDAPARSLRTAAQTSTEHRRHPLEDLDDESPFDAPRERRTIPATQGPKQVDQDRGSSFDPFDPIEIDAIETTAVEETPAIRRKLRAAKQ